MSSTSADDPISFEEVQRTLLEIECRYPVSISTPLNCNPNSLADMLIILSKEFDSVGIPAINLEESATKIFRQVVNNARSLIHLYRQSISHIKDVNIGKEVKDSQVNELYQKINKYKKDNIKKEEKVKHLYVELNSLNDMKKDFLKREATFSCELDKLKRYYLTKQSELERNLKTLQQENQRLYEIFFKNTGPNCPSEVELSLCEEWKNKEEFYKTTIQKLQNNNKELLEEVLDLKEEILLQKQ